MVKINDGLKAEILTWKEFDKFMIHRKFLSENILLVKYLSYAPIGSIKRCKISDELKEIIIYLLDTEEVNYQLAQELDIDEKELLEKIIVKSGLKQTLKFDRNKMADDVSLLIDKFHVLQGEVNAGNDSPQILVQIKKILPKLILHNKLTEADGNEILQELNNL